MVGLEDAEGDYQAPGWFVLVSLSWEGQGTGIGPYHVFMIARNPATTLRGEVLDSLS